MAASNDVKLLGAHHSPFANRVQFALNIKSVDYEFHKENLPEKSELLLKSNPVHKKIPVLIHGDQSICESNVIVEYIDEVWSNGLAILPSDPYERATARFWGPYVDEKWFPALRSLTDAKEDTTKVEILEKLHEGTNYLEDVLVKSSNGKDYFGGDDLGFLDIALGCFLGWMRVSEINSDVKIFDEAKTPALVKWSEKFTSHPAVKGTLPEVEELLELLKRMQAKAATAAEASK